jgi:hypothetical protein
MIKCLGEHSNKEVFERFLKREETQNWESNQQLKPAVIIAHLKQKNLESVISHIDQSNLDDNIIEALLDFWISSRNNDKVFELIESIKKQNKLTLALANSIFNFYKSVHEIELIHSFFR